MDVVRRLESEVDDAAGAMIAREYAELRAIAHRRLFGQAFGGTLSTTALVHEAYLRLVDPSRVEWRDRAHFLALTALAMRNVLVDRARAQRAGKRAGAHQHVTFDDERVTLEDQAEVLLQLDEALERLAAWEPRLAQVVECRFFGGLTETETAEALGVTPRTVQRDWVKARVLLRRALDV